MSAVSQYLIRTKKSTALALILESAEPREVHHFATLLGYGACAVNPYLAHETIGQLIDEGLLDKDYYAAVEDYNNAILNGIVKIASKMGISTIQSYQSSQIFEAVGISQQVIDKYFTGTVSRVRWRLCCPTRISRLARSSKSVCIFSILFLRSGSFSGKAAASSGRTAPPTRP